jgi:predicted nucleic acid-binding Zn ribbon protein
VKNPPLRYDCIECGGAAHLISYLPEDGEVETGVSLAYRCSDCNDRFDVVWEADDGSDLTPSDGR